MAKLLGGHHIEVAVLRILEIGIRDDATAADHLLQLARDSLIFTVRVEAQSAGDGHAQERQHVHHVPILRDVFERLLEQHCMSSSLARPKKNR